MLRNLVVLLSIALVGLFVFVNVLLSHLLTDFGNLGLVTGAGIATVTATIFFLYSYVTDQSLKSHLRDHRLASGRAKRSRQARKARATGAMCASVECLIYYCSLLAEMGGRHARVPKSKRPQFRGDFEALRNNIAAPVGELERMLDSADCPDDRTRGDVLAALDRLGDAPPTDGEVTVDAAQYRAVSRLLGPVLTRLGHHLEPTTERPPRRPGAVGEPGGLALTIKRRTCPPGAPIRMTVEAASPFPHRKIAIAILDEGFDELEKETKDAIEQASEPPTALDIDMKPRKKLDAGHEYIARATCGDLYGEAVFVVENVAPTVRVDRPTCTIGDIIAVTVEDPAAGAGGAEKGLAGTARRRRLVVESPHDRDDSCRLRAAGASAGTFCGRIRCVGACGAASSGRRAWAWGEGAEDIDIACEPDQVIRIRYESEAGEAKTAVLVKGPGTPAAGGGDTDRLAAGESGCRGGDGGTEPEPRCREGDEGSCMRGAPEGARGRVR